MVSLKKIPFIPVEIVSDPAVMGGQPVVSGTRVPAATIVAYLKEGRSRLEIFEDYPTLPIDGIDTVIAWATERYGVDWMNAPQQDHPSSTGSSSTSA